MPFGRCIYLICDCELPVSASLTSEIEPLALIDESESPESASMMSEIEKLLFYDDDDANDGCDGGDFASDLFSDLFEPGMKCAEVAPDEIIAGDAPAEAPETEAPEKEEDDPVSKKRKRQMRNKEAAMKSRERKNLYVKELEMKSKYMQMECQRLDFALRCCMAENMVLRQSLHRPLGAPMARQESAVLVMESLLLGSLFWLMSTVCLLLLPVLSIRKQKDVSRLGGSFAQEVVLTRNIANERIGSGLGLVILRRRCRGMKIKMRAMLLSSYVTPVLLASG